MISFLNQLTNKEYGILGLFTALLIVCVVALFKLYQKKSDQLDAEKDKEIADAREGEAKLTLVLEENNNILKILSVYVQKNNKE